MMQLVKRYSMIMMLLATIFMPYHSLFGSVGSDTTVADSSVVATTSVDTAGVFKRLNSYYTTLIKISGELTTTSSMDSLLMIDKDIKRIDLKWKSYYGANEKIVGENESLITVTVEWQSLLTQVNDTLTYKQGLSQAITQLNKVNKELIAQDSLYDAMVEKAISLSLVKAMSKPLDKLKSDEQIAIGGVNTDYGAVKQLSAQYVELKPLMVPLDSLYVDIKRRSEIIQAQAFKPLFERIKEYLMGLAAVAMILMFVNMLYAKYKQAVGEAKKLKDLKKMMGGDKQYPTI